MLNKDDLIHQLNEEEIPYSENKKVMKFSASTGFGIEELESYIHELFLDDKISYDDEIYITNIRQKEALLEAKNSLLQLKNSVECGMPEDFYTIDLTNIYESLGKIIGETIEDDIVDKIFKDFCMGK